MVLKIINTIDEINKTVKWINCHKLILPFIYSLLNSIIVKEIKNKKLEKINNIPLTVIQQFKNGFPTGNGQNTQSFKN